MPVPDVGHQPSTDCRSQPPGHGIGSVGIVGVANNQWRLASDGSETCHGPTRVAPFRTADEVVCYGLSAAEGIARAQRSSQGSSGGAVRMGFGVIAGDAPEGTNQRVSVQIGLESQRDGTQRSSVSSPPPPTGRESSQR